MAIRADVAVIGAGPGGYVAAIRAAQLGAKVVCLDKRWIGGVCLNEGCVPTKALLRTAEVYSLVRESAKYGVISGEPKIDWTQAQARKAKVVKQLVSGVETLLKRLGVQIIMGEASFTGANTLNVQLADGKETVVADNIIIATGSRGMQLPIPGLDDPNVIDYAGALALESLPASVCVIGGGAIGLEFASLFSSLGVQASVVEMLPRLAPLMDASISEGLAWTFGKQGIDIHTNTRVAGVARTSAGFVVNVTTPDGARQLEAEKVLVAVGRVPNTEGLGLETVGLRPTRRGIEVDNHMRTAVPHIYAIGDVAIGGPMLAHVASHQGMVAAENALGHHATMDYAAIPNCIFSIPEAASVGLTEEQARGQGYDVQTGLFALQNNPKALASGDTDGFVKVVSEASYGTILGLHIVGPHASDLVLEGTMAMSLEATLDELERTVHPHPTLGESIFEAGLAARGRAIHLPKK